MFHVKHHAIKHHIVPRETFTEVDKLIKNRQNELNTYLSQLNWWNKRVNLVSRDVPRETLVEHIRHSLLLTQLNVYKKSDNIVDAGTGGGLPGIPLAISSRNKRFILNDIVSKKTMALKQIIRELTLDNVEVSNKSVSELQVDKTFLLISKHAFKIDQLIRLTKGFPWSAMVFYKGIDFEDEIDQVDLPLDLDIFDLYKDSNEPFYEGKSIIIVSKQ